MKALAMLNTVVVVLTVVKVSYAQSIKQGVFNEGMGGGLLDVGGPVGGYLGQMGPGARAGYDAPGIDNGIGPVGGGGTFGGNYQGGGALTNLGSYGPGFMGGQLGGVGPMGGGANLGTVTGIVGNGVRGSLSRDRNEEREERRARRREERERRREERRRLREERRLLREEKRRERLERRRLGSRRSDSEEDLAGMSGLMQQRTARREKATLGLSAVSAGLSAVNTVGTLSTLGRLGAFGGGNNVGGLGGGISGRRCTTCI